MIDAPLSKDIPSLINQALHDSGLTQYQLAQRLARIRACAQCGGEGTIKMKGRRKPIPCEHCNGTGRSRTASQDQQLRRIRRFGQIPTEEYAFDLARAFEPELLLPDDWFFVERPTVTDLREATYEAMALVPRLQDRLDEYEKELKRLRKRLDGLEGDNADDDE